MFWLCLVSADTAGKVEWFKHQNYQYTLAQAMLSNKLRWDEFVKQKLIYLDQLFTVLYCFQFSVISEVYICSHVLLFQSKHYFLICVNCRIGSKRHHHHQQQKTTENLEAKLENQVCTKILLFFSFKEMDRHDMLYFPHFVTIKPTLKAYLESQKGSLNRKHSG